jgi:hypothetical protein
LARPRQPGSALTQKLRFETFLLELSAAFATVPVGGLENQIEEWLEKLTAFIDVDRSSLWELVAGERIRLLYFHAIPGLPTPSPDATAGEMLWLTDQYRRGNVVIWSRVPDDIPPQAAGEHAWARRISAKSVLCIPMSAGPVIRSIVFPACASTVPGRPPSSGGCAWWVKSSAAPSFASARKLRFNPASRATAPSSRHCRI